MTLRDELELSPAAAAKAGRIVDDLFDDIITALRCDRRFAKEKLSATNSENTAEAQKNSRRARESCRAIPVNRVKRVK